MFAATLDTELTIRMSWIAVRLFNAPPKLVGGMEDETMQQLIYSLRPLSKFSLAIATIQLRQY